MFFLYIILVKSQLQFKEVFKTFHIRYFLVKKVLKLGCFQYISTSDGYTMDLDFIPLSFLTLSGLCGAVFSSPRSSSLPYFSPPLRAQAASRRTRPTSPPTWRLSLRCRRRERRGRRPGSRRRCGGARSGPSKPPSSPRSERHRPDECRVVNTDYH